MPAERIAEHVGEHIAEHTRRASRAPSFLRALLFALFAGLGALPFQLLFGTPWDHDPSLAVYQLGLAVLAVIAGAPSLRSALGAGALAAMLCAALALTLPGIATATLGALCALGLARSALCYPRPFARALAFELLLALPSAVAFALLHDGYVLGNSLAVWAFWLVQSAFALLPGTPRATATSSGDPFEAAASAAERLMASNTAR
jgi:hypothetical protein